MNPAGMTGKAGDQELTADRIRGFAVHAGAGFGTGGGQAKTLGIGGGGNGTGTLHGAVHIITDLVHANDEKDFPGALGNGGNPVGIPVDIDQNAVLGDGVGA